jgi:glycosyltransferase involved in cell wall biosynthesis
MKLAVMTSHSIQYQAPWFRALAQKVDLEVFFGHRQDAEGQAAAGFGHAFEWDIPLYEGYRFHWLENVSAKPGVDAFAGCDTPGVADELGHGAFDACVVFGWYLKSSLQAVRACRRLGIPVLMRGDSQLGTPRPWARRAAKYVPYRWFLSRLDAHLYVGQANRDYLHHYGVPDDRLFFVPHFVENDRFAAASDRARADGTSRAIRTEAGAAAGDVVFLFAGKLVGKKRPADFVEAVARAHRLDRRIRGAVVGSGPLEEALRRQAEASRAPVHFLGFRNQSAIPACYAAADCLVLPSDGGETWGLVVNEAMACGLPAIVSDAVGCAPDLIDEGRTGSTFPLGNVDALAGRLQQTAALLAADRGHFAGPVAARIAQYAVEPAVAGTLRALDHVVRRSTISVPR